MRVILNEETTDAASKSLFLNFKKIKAYFKYFTCFMGHSFSSFK